MSTPTTAAAPLAPYGHHSHHHYPYHNPHPAYSTNATSAYRNQPSSIISPFGSSSLPSLAGYAVSTPGSSRPSHRIEPIEAVAHLAAVHPPAEMLPPANTSQHNNNNNLSTPRTEEAPPAKRRRSDGPNWSEFYKNGLPKEVIVIEDTPEPEQEAFATVPAKPFSSSSSSNNINSSSGSGTNNNTTTTTTNPPTNGAHSSPVNNSAKKRKRDDERTAYDPVYGTRPRLSQATTPQNPSSTNSSTISTESTAYRLCNASTSLSSTGTFDDPQNGQRRKRTRRDTAESKREIEFPESTLFAPYIPPAFPPKKAPEVSVKVVREASCHLPVFCGHEY